MTAFGEYVDDGTASTIKQRDYKDATDLIGCVSFKPSHFTRGKDGAPSDISPPLTADADKGDQDAVVCAPQLYSIMPMNSGKDYKARPVDVAQPLMTGQVGGNQGGDFVVQPPIAFSSKDYGKQVDSSDTSEGPNVLPVAVGFAQNQRDEVRTMDVAGALAAEPGMKQQTYVAHEPTVLMERGRDGGSNLEYRQDGTSNAILTPNGGRGGFGVGAIQHEWAVRRLTPVECARLQGFPDDYLDIEFRGKPAADGNKYKALGNSWAVPCGKWILERIERFI